MILKSREAGSMRDPERDSILRGALQAAGLGGILAWYPEDILMLSGSHSCYGMDLCLYPSVGVPILYAPQGEPEDTLPPGFALRRFSPGPAGGTGRWEELGQMLRRDLQDLGIGTGSLGIAADEGIHAVSTFSAESPPLTFAGLERILRDAGACDATEFFTDVGLVKTGREIDEIRRANRAARAGLEAFFDGCAAGRTEAELAAAVEAAVQCRSGRDGCRLARGWAHVQAGPNSCFAGTFSRSSGRILAEGDLVVLELAVCADGYWSDLTRTSCAGQPDERARALLDAVREAQRAAIRAVRPGATGEEVDRAARSLLEQRGYGAGFMHNCGHPVGFRYHDRGPVHQHGSQVPLRAGMIITVEPGAYGASFGGGARFEDDVLVTPDGAEILSRKDEET
jgi:Xaa-Pro dipeptidase